MDFAHKNYQTKVQLMNTQKISLGSIQLYTTQYLRPGQYIDQSVQQISFQTEISQEIESKGNEIMNKEQKNIESAYPEKNANQKWTQQQFEILYEYHNKYGNKWSKLSEAIHRNDNHIKNFFYSTQRRALRKLNKIITIRKIKGSSKIKCSILNKILSTAQCKFIDHDYPNIIVKYCVQIKNVLLKFDELVLKNTSPIIKEVLSKITEVRNFFSRRNKNKKKYPNKAQQYQQRQNSQKFNKIDSKILQVIKKKSTSTFEKVPCCLINSQTPSFSNKTNEDFIESYNRIDKSQQQEQFLLKQIAEFSYEQSNQWNLYVETDHINSFSSSHFNAFFESDLNLILN